MDWDNDRRHVVLHAPPGGKTSISLFGGDDATQNTYQSTSQQYAPPPPPQASFNVAAGAPTEYDQPTKYGVYGSGSNENTNPYMTSNNSAYSSYAPKQEVTTFGAPKAMRSEHNLGGDGSERSSVKVHHPPGGGGSLNLFGDHSEPTYEKPKYTPPAYQPPQYEAPIYGSSYDQPASYAQNTYEQQPSYESSAGYGNPSYNQPPSNFSYGQSSAPYADYSEPPQQNYYGEEQKAPMEYNAAPSGFTSGVSYGQAQSIQPSHLNVSSQQTTFGQRVESGLNSGPTTEKSSVRVHAPPGGKSSITF